MEPVQVAKPRPRREWIMLLIQPLADRGVAQLARLGVAPTTVVLAHGAVGLAAAALLATPHLLAWWGAAVLLQIKTLLDNMDGGLARATGTVTEAGRYLDTVVDLIVNVALFLALARLGPVAPAVLALVGLTLILSLDYNLEQRYREAHGAPSGAAVPLPAGAPAWLLTLPRSVYLSVLSPQDRLVRKLDAMLFALASGRKLDAVASSVRQSWSDLFSTASVVNLGLSTQLAMLGLLCLIGRPYLYVPLIALQLAWVAIAQVLRVVRLRQALRRDGGLAA